MAASECYIPVRPDPERLARAMSIWREVAARLGVNLPPAQMKGDEDV